MARRDEATESPLNERDAVTAIDELFGAIDQYRTSSGFAELLRVLRQLPGVGPYNGLLLHIQRPGVTFVASVSGWREYGREVKREAHPLVTLRAFGPVEFVYDLDDTTGPPLPDDVRHPFRVDGGFDSALLDRALKNVQSDAIVVLDAKFAGQLAGRVSGQDSDREQVLLNSGKPAAFIVELNTSLTSAAKFATLAHELAHIYCGHLGRPIGAWWQSREDLDRRVREFEAEAVAWIVCARKGLDPGSYRYLDGYLLPGGRIPDISLNEVLVAANHVELLVDVKFRAKAAERAKARVSTVGSGVLTTTEMVSSDAPPLNQLTVLPDPLETVAAPTPSPANPDAAPQECPSCRCWSPAGAVHCDCGYNFATKVRTPTANHSIETVPGWSWSAVLRRAVFSILYAGLLGLPWGVVAASVTGQPQWRQQLPRILGLILFFTVAAFRTASTRSLLLALAGLFVVNIGVVLVVTFALR